MVLLSLTTIAAAPSSGGFDVNQLLGLLGAGAGTAVGWKLITLIVDKVVPSRSDKRSDVETSLGALARTIEILSAEKASDAAAVARANARIVQLEADGAADYDVIKALRETKDDLERRISQKDEHIARLSRELAMYGARVSIGDDGHLRVESKATTGPISVVRGA